MQLVCPACNRRLQVPDEKLPPDQAVRLTCPACQERFSYDPRSQQRGAGVMAELGTHPQMAAMPSFPQGGSTDLQGNTHALICLDDTLQREACQKALMSLGYTSDVMPDQFKALEYLRQVPYRLFVVDAAFDGTSIDTNLVLTFLRERPLQQRRYVFVMLCAAEVTTGDAMLAYSQGVNLVINHADVPHCSGLLLQHIDEQERRYKVYREIQKQLGRDV